MSKGLAIVLAVLSVAALAWIGGELHYRSCVAAAEARTPVTSDVAPEAFPGSGASPSPPTLSANGRSAAVNGCSRLP